MAYSFGVELFVWLLTLFWGIFILVTGLLKILHFGLYGYIIHLTNYSWTLLGVFLLASLGSIAQSSAPFTYYVVALLFFPVVALTTGIAIGVWILLAQADNFLVDIFDKIPPGIVIIGNDVYHFIPVLTVVFFAWTHGSFILDSFRHVLAPISSDTPWHAMARALFYLYQLFAVLIIIAVYLVVLALLGTSVNEVYDTDMPAYLVFVLATVSSLVFVGIPLLMFTCCYGIA